MRLITIRVSHFNERARWALDRFAVPYEEEPYMPMLHVPAVLRATGGRGGRADRESTRYSTPLLVTDTGRVLSDSGEIVRYASDTYSTPETTLYPEGLREAVMALEADIVAHLGASTRRIAYGLMFAKPGLLESSAEQNVGGRQARWFRRLSPVIVWGVHRALRVTESGCQRSLERALGYLDSLERRLGGSTYALGERFTAADLTLAALLAPLLVPSAEEGYGARLPALDELTAEAAELAQSVRRRPIGERCLRLFRTERGERAVPCPVACA